MLAGGEVEHDQLPGPELARDGQAMTAKAAKLVDEKGLAELLLEKETVLGKELDDLIKELRPGIELPSNKLEENEPEEAARPASEST